MNMHVALNYYTKTHFNSLAANGYTIKVPLKLQFQLDEGWEFHHFNMKFLL